MNLSTNRSEFPLRFRLTGDRRSRARYYVVYTVNLLGYLCILYARFVIRFYIFFFFYFYNSCNAFEWKRFESLRILAWEVKMLIQLFIVNIVIL